MTPLEPWMRRLLRFVGTFNILAGVSMLFFYHEGFKLVGLPPTKFALPVQLVGVLVGLFGVGYHMVATKPLENYNVLLLGFWSKTLGSVLAVYSVVFRGVPPVLLVLVFFADIIYLPPFVIILRRLSRLPRSAADT